MEILVMSHAEALVFEPTKRTYALRIFATFPEEYMKHLLKQSTLYVHIEGYVFDHVSERYGGKALDKNTASKIVTDFERYHNDVECLLVHCTFGQNRSPAVAMALNDIFKLGYSNDEMVKQYDEFDSYVYETIMKVR